MASDSPPSPADAGRDIPNPTIHVPPSLNLDDPTVTSDVTSDVTSPSNPEEVLAAILRRLGKYFSTPRNLTPSSLNPLSYPSSLYHLSGVSVTSDVTSPNNPYHLSEEEEVHAALRRRFRNEWSDPDPEFDQDPDSPVDAYSGDHFRMFEFEVQPCACGRSHDWTDCPFAHPGENAGRRDPREFHYSGTACADFLMGHCKNGDSCEFAHGVFEYRTQPCKDGTSCKRRVCFFAHTLEQLRVLPLQSPCGSNSPPMSPRTRSVSRSLGSSSVSEMVASLRKVKSLPASWNVQVGPIGSVGSPGFVSPRGSMLRTGVEAGHLLTGSHFGVGRTDITPMNNEFRMFIEDAESQTGNYPPPLEISGDNSHLEQHLRLNRVVILFVTSEIIGMVFEIIYQESHRMPYFFIWIVCVTIAMYAARVLAKMEGGMANREQFAVYLRCFSFLLLELLQYWGIDQGNYVTALKIILKVTGAVIGWWVVGVLKSYMDAFGMHLPLRRRDD